VTQTVSILTALDRWSPTPVQPNPPWGDLGPFGSLRRSRDPALVRMLTDRVALEYNTSSSGVAKFGEKPAAPRWIVVPGYEEVPCRVALMPPEKIEGAAQTQWITPAIVTFGVALTADIRHRIIWNHPTMGPMPLYFRGPVKEQMRAHHWTGYCQNREV
jgi:hypothetical protein